MAIGTVLAVELEVPEGQGGYGSGAARAVTQALLPRGVYARPLGNVVYLMATPFTPPETCASLQAQLTAAVEEAG